MHETRHRHFLALDPDADTHRLFQAVRRELNTLSVAMRPARVPVHLTVKAPFDLTLAEANRLRGRLEAMVARKQIGPTAGQIGDLTEFDSAIVYLVEGTEVANLVRYVLMEFESQGYPRGRLEGRQPHLTIARVENLTERGRALRHLAHAGYEGRPVDFTGLVLYRLEGDAYTADYRISLQQRAA